MTISALNKHTSKTLFAAGFTTILLLLLVVIILWIKTATLDHERLQALVNKQLQTRLTADMLYAAHHRVVNLYRMTTVDDPFEQDDSYLAFRDLGETYLKAREKILAGKLTLEEKQTLRQIDKLAAFGGTEQEHIAQLINAGERKRALHLLNESILPNRLKLTKELRNIFDSQREFVERALEETARDQRNNYYLITSLGTVATLLGIFTVFVVRRMGRTEAELIEQGDRVRALYEASSISGLSLTEQINETLKLGCRLLGMEIGKVCHIDEKKDSNVFLHIIAPDEYGIRAGADIPLDRTFCSIPFKSDQPVMISHVKQSEYKDFPCYEFSHLESYIAAPIWVNGEKFGTVNFSSVNPKPIAFNDRDKELVMLIGNWISVALERQIAHKINIAKESTEAANITKSAFLTNMSHELRTPLNAIIGYNELMKDEVTDSGDTQYLTDINKISQASHHLLNLVNDILDLAKIESGKMELHVEHFALTPLVKEITSTVQAQIAKNHNTLVVNCESQLGIMRSDLTKVRQIILNLLSNSCKFTEHGTITLSISTTKKPNGNWAIFEVKDTGIGMTREQMQGIFNTFAQADSSISPKYGGTGLGLTISRHLCEMIGGSINADSVKDVGSTFTLSVPMVLALDSNDPALSNLSGMA